MSKIVFTVTELNQATQQILEHHFNPIWVEGEISNISRPASGHLYFSLKDSKAQIRCAMFRMHAQKLSFEPRLGLLVQVKAKVSIYPDRGDYQLIIESMEMAGDGLLRQAYEQLLKKLAALGLFEDRHKKKIPIFPKKVGIITSPTGAAIRDILTVLNRRFPALSILIYPTAVQGAAAAPEIVKAIEHANRHAKCDVLIVARGGGSLEDLWPFNEEIVAYALFASTIPIVTGIGHEIDTTIADFIGDRRAATPSAAAELVSPNQFEVSQQLSIFEKRLKMHIIQQLQYRAQRLDGLIKRLRHPRESILSLMNRLKIANQRLLSTLKRNIQDKHRLLASSARALDSVSPLATLSRGYVIALHQKTKAVIRSYSDVNVNDILCLKLSDGEITCKTLATARSEAEPK